MKSRKAARSKAVASPRDEHVTVFTAKRLAKFVAVTRFRYIEVLFHISGADLG